MDKILDETFKVSNNLELTQELLGVLINMVDGKSVSTPDEAIYFASQQNTISALLHIALDYVFNAKVSLKKLQDEKECAA